jgi:hypothetical protein
MKLNLLVHKVATRVENVNETIKNICETYNREKQYPITIVLEFFLVYTLRKLLSYLSDAPWYVPNTIIKRELQIPTVKQEARRYGANYRKRLDTDPSNLASTLLKEQFETRRIKRLYPADIVTDG